MDLSVI